MEKRLTVLVLWGEDVPMTAMNLWLMSTFPNEVSLALLFSFAFNCIMLGAKVPEVVSLARLAVRRIGTRAALERECESTKLKATRQARRRSSTRKDVDAGAVQQQPSSSSVKVLKKPTTTWSSDDPKKDAAEEMSDGLPHADDVDRLVASLRAELARKDAEFTELAAVLKKKDAIIAEFETAAA